MIYRCIISAHYYMCCRCNSMIFLDWREVQSNNNIIIINLSHHNRYRCNDNIMLCIMIIILFKRYWYYYYHRIAYTWMHALSFYVHVTAAPYCTVEFMSVIKASRLVNIENQSPTLTLRHLCQALYWQPFLVHM